MIYLLRHGQTEYNVAHRFQGQSDSALTPLGRRQADALGQVLAARLDAAAVLLTSPLGRAVATAGRVAAALPGRPRFLHDARLAEVCMGAWDGLTRDEIAAGWPDARRGLPKKHWMFHAPGGETLAEVVARLAAVLAEAEARAGDTVMVSHAVTGRLLRGLHSGLPQSEALLLDAPQNAIFALGPAGAISRIAIEGV